MRRSHGKPKSEKLLSASSVTAVAWHHTGNADSEQHMRWLHQPLQKQERNHMPQSLPTHVRLQGERAVRAGDSCPPWRGHRGTQVVSIIQQSGTTHTACATGDQIRRC